MWDTQSLRKDRLAISFDLVEQAVMCAVRVARFNTKNPDRTHETCSQIESKECLAFVLASEALSRKSDCLPPASLVTSGSHWS